MKISISKFHGISDELIARLEQHGFKNSSELLEAAQTSAARKALAEMLGVEPQVILKLANRADLARLRGIGGVFSDLLEQAGVDTVKELANRRPENLYAKLVETNNQIHLAGRVPTMQAVANWVSQAKELPRVLEY